MPSCPVVVHRVPLAPFADGGARGGEQGVDEVCAELPASGAASADAGAASDRSTDLRGRGGVGGGAIWGRPAHGKPRM